MTAPVFVCSAITSARPGDIVALEGSEARHAATVQRRRIGERIDLVDGVGARATGLIVEVAPELLRVAIDATGRDGDPTTVLVQALAKGGRDEQAIEAATELGATRLIPWAAERSVVVWREAKAARGRERWLAIATAATKVSRRAAIPQVDPVVSTRELVASVSNAVASGALVFVLHEEASVPLAGQRIDDGDIPVWLVVGPEGGVSEPEVALLVDAGATAVLLGPHVLRSSTAGPAAIAVVATLRGSWALGARADTLEA